MAFLKSGDPVVVDTHVLAEAARQERDGERGSQVEFLEALLERCPRVVLSHGQESEDRRRRELPSALRLRGFRFPVQSSLLDRLDAGGKLTRLARSAVPKLGSKVESVFNAPGHDNVSDDLHLYEAAAARGTVVVTLDPNLLRRSQELLKCSGVETLEPAQVLARWGKGGRETP